MASAAVVEDSQLNFCLEEINGEPRAVLEGAVKYEKVLLQHFLHPAPHFVPDVLYEISLVERLAVESSGFETEHIDVCFFRDRVVITSKSKKEGENEPLRVVMAVDEAKLMLLEWGAMVQRWRMGRRNQNNE